ncbi:hypothetical protein AGMMS50239_38210 [Bacteroidia bacterium]|nr:hypothetical protein AGMMS50239_38210 [Bacteroidia bacterium]
MSESKNDIAWQKIFDKHLILDKITVDGSASISATEINEFREARLMTKFDHKSQLPKLFENNKLSILPTSRGTYEIGSFETFCDFNKDDVEITPINFPTFLESIDYKDITSESTAINCAYVSKILNDFTGEDTLLPTVSGRMSSSLFDFKINSAKGLFKINVGNSQIEIDGGYEGDNSLNLIEAKNYISDDFLIRQLFYPYRLWNSKIIKQVRPIFLTYSNGIFHLREYIFEDAALYNSIKLIKHKKYAVQEGAINTESIQQVLDTVKIVKEPQFPFPQADSFERVINLCELLRQRGFLSKEEITQNYDFDSRQTDYYSNAAKYLGLIENYKENGQIGCSLTQEGLRIFTLSIIDRQFAFAKLILSRTAFNKTLQLYFEKGDIPSYDEVVEIMKQSKLYNINSDETYKRRASTVMSWVNWIIGLIEE